MLDFLRHTPKNFTLSEADRARQREVPENLWVKCTRCKELSYVKEFENSFKVCQKCGYHARLSAAERLQWLLDEGSFQEVAGDIEPGDPLAFVSEGQGYRDKLDEAQTKTGMKEAVVAGTGTIENLPLTVAVVDFGFMGGSMGTVYGEKISRAVETAIGTHTPLLTVSAAGGARMQEGMFSLMQMAKTTAALVQLGEAHLPYFSLLTDPCFGGVTASYAVLADITMAEPGALVGFAGPRVIEQTIRQKLPAGFQTAEFLLQHGMIDMVVSRRELRGTLARLLRLYGAAVEAEAP
ncbi:MAG TPA: acetyl-CoA carboxylase, carboxyltransferase subunit beta [Chloroflexia bacterium]|nr:acetyl-CoA carboxylase, carboxyltransferase subunit beta [Chloroflexia bacterium]